MKALECAAIFLYACYSLLETGARSTGSAAPLTRYATVASALARLTNPAPPRDGGRAAPGEAAGPRTRHLARNQTQKLNVNAYLIAPSQCQQQLY